MDDKKLALQKLYGDLKSLSALFGGGLAATEGQSTRPDLLTMGVGGAMQGFGFGGPLGGLLGLGAGLISGAKRNEATRNSETEAYNNMISSKTVEPTYYAKKGALVDSTQEKTTMQTQDGEVAAFPGGMITPVKSQKKHKEMDKDEITDVFPALTWVADDETMLRQSDADKIVLGAKPLIYSEYPNEESKGEYEKVKLSDLWGKDKEISSAQALLRIKNKIKIPQMVEDEVADPIAHATAADNSQTRTKYISGVMELTGRKNKSLRKQMDLVSLIEKSM